MLRTTAITFASLFGVAAPALAAPQGALQPPIAPLENPTTAEKAVLGKMLFWDEQLSSDGTVACGTCHQGAAGGGDPRLTGAPAGPGPDGMIGTADDVFGSPGIAASNAFGHFVNDATFGFDPQATDRNSPSMIGAAYFSELFWDGRAATNFFDPDSGTLAILGGGALESQSLVPIMSDIEMAYPGRSWDAVIARLDAAQPLALASNLPSDVNAAIQLRGAGYGVHFAAAFGTPEITSIRIAFALAAYQRTLIPDQAKFDRVMRGQANFTQAEQRGFNAFRSPQSRCNQCHTGTLFSDSDYHNLGLRPISEDDGRRSVTGVFSDRGRFKTPTLRNVTLRRRFFHNGAPGINSLNALLTLYDQDGGPFAENKDVRLNGLSVPPPVRNDIRIFLGTLTDPRVASESFPFDRPTLRSEQAIPGPEPLGVGAIAGSTGFAPELILTSPTIHTSTEFRIGVKGGFGGQFALLKLGIVNNPGGASTSIVSSVLPRVVQLSGSGAGEGYSTYVGRGFTNAAMQGLTLQGNWLMRDLGAPLGYASTETVRFTIE